MAEDYSTAIAGLANQIANFAGLALSASANKHQQQRAIDYNWQMAKWQNATNIENWQAQNEYNLPINQMRRLKDAGLNPNLVYDKGASTTASSLPSAPSAGAYPRINYAQYAQMQQDMILNNAIKVANIEKTSQETKNLQTYQRNMALESQMKELRMIAQNFSNSKSEVEAREWARYFEAKINLLDSQDGLNIARMDYTNEQQDYLHNVLTPLGRANIDYINSRRDLTVAEKTLIPYKINLMSAQVNDLLASAGLKQEQIRKVGQEITNLAGEWMLGQSRKYGVDQDNAIKDILLRNGLDIKNSGIVGAIQKIVYMLTD